jgi:Bacterial PH domain
MRLSEDRWYSDTRYRRTMTLFGVFLIAWGWGMLLLGLNPKTSHGSEPWYVWFWFVAWNVIGVLVVLESRRDAVRIRTEGIDVRRLWRTRSYRWDEIARFEAANNFAPPDRRASPGSQKSAGNMMVAVLESGERRHVIRFFGVHGSDRGGILEGLGDELGRRRRLPSVDPTPRPD